LVTYEDFAWTKAISRGLVTKRAPRTRAGLSNRYSGRPHHRLWE